MNNVRSFLQSMESSFEQANIPSARWVALDLVSNVLGCNRPTVLMRGDLILSAEQLEKLNGFAERILTGEPVQYVISEVDFREITLKSDARALIPRPETELLVGEILEVSKSFDFPRVVDVGTGSGCIIISLAVENPKATFTAVDISEAALSLAKENAEQNGVADKIEWKKSSLLDDFAEKSLEIVVSNPPYINTSVCAELDRSVRDFEPMSALDGGDDGLDLYRVLIKQAKGVLVSGGWILMEMGFDQGEALRDLLEKNGFQNIEIKKDLAGLDRMAIGQKPIE